MVKTFRVFLSATARDLAPYRQATERILSRNDVVKVIQMEDFTADTRPPRELCEARVKDCDVMVCLIGFNYGSSPPDDEKSFTHLEYDYAQSLGIPVLPFIAPEGTALPAFREPEEQYNRVVAFRESLKGGKHTSAPRDDWQSPQMLAQSVSRAINAYIRDATPQVSIPTPREYTERLKATVADLKRQIEAMGDNVSSLLLNQQSDAAKKLTEADKNYEQLRELIQGLAVDLTELGLSKGDDLYDQILDDISQENFERAKTYLLSVAEQHDHREATARFNLGNIAAHDVDLSGARTNYEIAEKLAPEREKYLVYAALACASIEDVEASAGYGIQAPEQAERDQNAAEITRASYAMVAVEYRRGSNEQIMAWLERGYEATLALDPASREALNSKAALGGFLVDAMIDFRRG